MSAVGSKASRSAAATAVAPAAKPRSLAALALGALGVVYGDIGTSPLYAFRQCLTADASGPANPQAVLGLLSLVFWSLTVIICVKYLTVLMRADNRGGGGAGFLVLGSVILAITGAEALYADMGHFGPHPIRVAWYAVVCPALLLNYFGQGALALDHGAAATHPFFQLAPSWALYPLIGLATAATVIASQALISGEIGR